MKKKSTDDDRKLALLKLLRILNRYDCMTYKERSKFKNYIKKEVMK